MSHSSQTRNLTSKNNKSLTRFKSIFGVFFCLSHDFYAFVILCLFFFNRVCVFDYSFHYIQSFDQHVLKKPLSVFIDDFDQILVSDGKRKDVLMFNHNSGGRNKCTLGTQNKLSNPVDIVVDRRGFVFVTDYWEKRVLVYSKQNLSLITSIETKEKGLLGSSYPSSVSVNPNKDELFVVDGNYQIKVFDIRSIHNIVFLRSLKIEVSEFC